jgi:UDP-N-acetylglucosamine 4,6-dehydratase
MTTKEHNGLGGLRNATVLITGGGGSVSEALVPRLLEKDVKVVRILDNHEPSLSAMETTFTDDRIRLLAGDVREEDRLQRAMQDVDVVFHMAAMKHVDLSEYNPFEAVKTNVVGLQNVVDAAIDSDVTHLVNTSSDKAVNPANTMGTTKLLGEKLVTAGNKYKGRPDLRLCSVRFGNVLGSSGSVVPLFERQIREGGPVTLTDRRMTRFFLSRSEMVDLLLSAVRLMQGGEVFVKKMDAMSIETLAETMISELAPVYDRDPSEIPVEVVGRRVGETIHEEVMTEQESRRAIERGDLLAIAPDAEVDPYLDYEPIDGFEPVDDVVSSSGDAELLESTEIISLLRSAGALEADV